MKIKYLDTIGKRRLFDGDIYSVLERTGLYSLWVFWKKGDQSLLQDHVSGESNLVSTPEGFYIDWSEADGEAPIRRKRNALR